jgi:hypothetical protein
MHSSQLSPDKKAKIMLRLADITLDRKIVAAQLKTSMQEPNKSESVNVENQ